ncbi:AI-2E family transporter [Thalassotalea ponticola]|uniref:AI-2E family transporter n=1 Tax=Thalassotalea ponticola TaxID=1523392 RepID=UPI0025B32A91|nr:AI-2E family transporter [Thalassotalea ponticola]MDN3653031.1 AI-2E family transporter [Thalassotalea ponticola]
MINYLKSWYQNKFSDPHVVSLTLLMTLSFLILTFFGNLLMPIIISLVLAFLLEPSVRNLGRTGLNRNKSVILVMLMFTGLSLALLFGLLPLLWQQTSNLVAEVPDMLVKGNAFLLTLPEKYPDIIKAEQIDAMIASIRGELISMGQAILQASLNSISNVVALIIYLILVPIMVFFFLKDKVMLVDGAIRFLPKESRLTSQVGKEMHQQIHNYIRGKVVEIVIIGVMSMLTFWILDLRYAVLLGALVGLSVLVPYVGATVVTVPVMLVALFQWGISPEFWYLMLAYAVIQIVDGNILVPLLFSEAVNLHPVAIIIAVIVFGGLWGFWGVFFAIPLATLVKAVINAWPSSSDAQEAQPDS